ncbi:MAG: YhcH/YjgK/YiaL family protein [Hungatella sp.]
MIFDLAKNLDFYKELGIADRYKKAVDFLKNTDLKNLATGKYEIEGSDVFANVVEYTTIPWEEAKFEAHEDYTDIQYMIEGSEVMTYAPISQLQVTVPYNSEKDVALFDNANPGLGVVVEAGQFMIFNPWDGHKPKAANGAPAPIKKVIVKIKEK